MRYAAKQEPRDTGLWSVYDTVNQAYPAMMWGRRIANRSELAEVEADVRWLNEMDASEGA